MPSDLPSLLPDLGPVAKPAGKVIEKLIDKVSSAGYLLYEPTHIRRIAKAKADAAIRALNSEVEQGDIRRRALRRWVAEEAQNQENLEAVFLGAVPDLSPDADPDAMSMTWIRHFFESSKMVSDEYVRGVWSRILATEANRPGRYSIQTIRTIADFDRRDAEDFVRLCRFCCEIDDTSTALVCFVVDDIYKRHGIDETLLLRLEELGVIRVDHGIFQGGFGVEFDEGARVNYYGKTGRLCPRENGKLHLSTGHVEHTRSGREIAQICKTAPVSGFWEYLVGRLSPQLEPDEDE